MLEDAAQAAGARLDGARAGSLGDAATFSFFPSKNLPCLGDGGAIVTDDDEVAATARGGCASTAREDKQTFTEVGYNSRLDELQAAVLRVLLPELDGWNEARRAAAAAYERAGARRARRDCRRRLDGAEHVYHLYVVRPAQAESWRRRWPSAASARGVLPHAGRTASRPWLRAPRPGPARHRAEPRAQHLALPMGTRA